MALDYDLVVIGSSKEGVYAAATAARLQARVALVTQNLEEDFNLSELIFCHSLAQIASWIKDKQDNPFALEVRSTTSLELAEVKEARNWSKEVNFAITQTNSLATLATLGVDVVYGKGEFCRLPQQALIVGNRKLRSRSYLIATGSYVVNESSIFENSSYLTLKDIYQNKDLSSLPSQLTIVGNSPYTLILAQSLARLGKEVILITGKARLLPYEDIEVVRLIQAQLEAEGIKILTNSPVTQSKNIGDKKWLQVGDRAIETDEIILMGKRKPNIEGLNLSGVGVDFQLDRLIVNPKLQTSNPRIYACGDVLGGYSLPHIAQYEANIALRNALFVPWFKTDYTYLPWAILTQPNVARVGLSENQARQKYGDDIHVIRQYWKNTTQAQITGKTTGLCKSIIRPNGEIVGVHLVGENAADLISAIALMLKSKIKLSKNGIKGLLTVDFPYVYPSFSEILQQIATTYQQQKLIDRQNWRNWLVTWFDFRK